MMHERRMLQGVAPRAARGFLAAITLLMACAAWVVADPATALAAPFPFEDKNNNGTFDPGVDTDITNDLKGGFFSTNESIVLPDGMKSVVTKDLLGVTLIAGKNVTIAGDLNAAGSGSGISVFAEAGSITIAAGTRLRAAEYVHMTAGRDIVLEAGTSITAAARSGAVISLSADGNISLMNRVRLQAHDAIDLTSNGGGVSVGPSVQLLTVNGNVSISALTDVVVNDSRIQASDTSIYSQGHLVDFQDNRVTAPRMGGSVVLYAAGSTINVSGTVFTNLRDDDLLFLAPTVIQ